jgi:hypothetical protein
MDRPYVAHERILWRDVVCVCVCVPYLTSLSVATFRVMNESEWSIRGVTVAGEGRSAATNRRPSATFSTTNLT